MTGRDDEMSLLLQAARRTVTERKAILCTLIGVPGIGKSRLVRELTTRLQADGTRVLRGRCLPYGDGITYWPLAEMCRAVADLTPALSQSEALDRMAAIADSRPVAERLAFAIGLSTTSPVEGSGVEKEIARAFRRLLEVVAAAQPLAVVFEDIHWAQPALLDLIEYLAGWIRGTPILIICPARPELLDHRPTWGGGRVEANRISLEALTRDDSAALVEALLHEQAIPGPLRDRILERSEGNPLFVEEVLRMLIENGTLFRREGRWAASGKSDQVTVPETVQAIIRARIDTLPPEERRLLQVASVVGRIFERSSLMAPLPDAASIDRQVEDAVLRDLVSEEGSAAEPTYRFKHILIRDAAYASLPKTGRAELHERFARWLPRLASQPGEVADIAAYHFESATLLQRDLRGQADPALRTAAVSALRSAAERAVAREDFGAGLQFAERALALDPASEDIALELRWLELEAVWRLGDFPRAGELGQGLLDAAQGQGRQDLEGRALVTMYHHIAHTEGPTAATAIAERACSLLNGAGDTVYEFEASMLVSQRGWWAGNPEQAYGDFAET